MNSTLGRAVLSVVAGVCVAAGANAQSGGPRFADTPDMKELPARWAPLMEEFRVPGMAVAVVKDGKLYAAEGFGTRDGETGHAVTPDTMFYIASVTKTYTAFAVCMLADQGKLSLDDPVKKHLPRFKLADEQATNKTTIRDLLCHRPGIDSDVVVGLDAYTGEITEDRYYYWLERAKVAGKSQYSNVHYTLLGRVIEAKSGLPWRDYLAERVFQPAGMTRTTGYASRMYGDVDCASPMELRNDFSWNKATTKKQDSVMHAAGGLGTTALDGARWIMLNVNDGEIGGKRLLSPQLAREMRTLQAPFEEPQGSLRIMKGFGLAWQVGTYAGSPLCSHGGGYNGASSYMAILPEQKAGFIILMNSDMTAKGLGDVMAIDLLNRLTGKNLAPDLLAGYQKRTAEIRERRAKEGQNESFVLRPDSLSGPVDAYAGEFRNEHLGTLRVTAASDGLRLSLGTFPLPLKAQEKDRFTPSAPFEAGQWVFEAPADGKVQRVRAEGPGKKEFVFER